MPTAPPSPPPAAPRLLTRPEVASALRVSLVTVDRLLARRELPSLRVGDRRLVRSMDLEMYIAARVIPAARP